MSSNYHPMWQNLGLNLEAHDTLLGVLGPLYEKVFLGQTNRPQGMDYFNFVISEVHGLRIKELLDAKERGGFVVEERDGPGPATRAVCAVDHAPGDARWSAHHPRAPA